MGKRDRQAYRRTLQQCSKFLQDSKLRITPVFDTAGSVFEILETKDINTAAIAGEHFKNDERFKILKENKPPYNIVIDIVEMPKFLALRVYENEVMALSNEKQMIIMEHLYKLKGIVEQFGYVCDFQGVPGDPPRSI